MPKSQVVDLCTVTPAELEGLWHHEEQWWREHLLWDISHPLEVLRRVIGRRGVPGKAVRVGTQTVGYTYYVISGSLGVLSGLVVAPAWNIPEVGRASSTRPLTRSASGECGVLKARVCPWPLRGWCRCASVRDCRPPGALARRTRVCPRLSAEPGALPTRTMAADACP